RYHDLQTTNLTEEICSNAFYEFFGEQLTTAGTYQKVTPSLLTGCDSTVNLTLTVKQVPALTISSDKKSICMGGQAVLTATAGHSSYNWGGGASASNTLTVTPSQTTTYTVVTQNTNGCSATASITIEVGETLTSTETLNICQGDVIDVFGQSVSVAGSHQKTFVSIGGCDSIATVVVAVNPLPGTFDVQGSGQYNTESETGLPVSLSSSEVGITYNLIKDGNIVNTLAGTGSRLDFGAYPEGIYTVEAKTAAGCAKIMNGSAVISLVTSVGNIVDGGIVVKVYPNPVEDRVFVDVQGNCDIRILSSTGQVIITKSNFTSGYIDLSNYPKGIYFIEVVVDGKKIIEKVLKQ
ncbi:MAG: T9SS type A sorting domain-containing protein, partial [Prolixibacteraceae bacterium]|nr:T9SS type A sorting domain-containing protein [Prolixibacteraceae bacterium]